MKVRNSCLTTFAALIFSTFADSAEPSAAVDGYVLVWADEFEVEGRPDPTNWTFEQGFARNRELQWYQSENAFCENGRLVIEGRREQKPNPNYEPGSSDWRTRREQIEYTSSSLTTSGRHSWQYGRFEVKARIQAEPGLWPAIWFLGVDGEWPSSGEIDLMEYYDGHILETNKLVRRPRPSWKTSASSINCRCWEKI